MKLSGRKVLFSFASLSVFFLSYIITHCSFIVISIIFTLLFIFLRFVYLLIISFLYCSYFLFISVDYVYRHTLKIKVFYSK